MVTQADSQPTLGIVVFARMSSSRLPGKMLRPFGAESLLARMIRRAATLGEAVVVATSSEPHDDPIARESHASGVPVHRGALDDVLGRALTAAEEFGFDAIARLCGDRPFFPLGDMRRGFDCVRASRTTIPDLLTTQTPVPCPPGLTTEIVSTEALRRAVAIATRPDLREHLTQVMYERTEDFELLELPTDLHALADQRFAVDTEDDYRRLSAVVDRRPDIGLSPHLAAEILRGTSGVRSA